MRVLLITGEGQCGIAEHGAYLAEAVRTADPTITIHPHTDLHPQSLDSVSVHDVIHLNYQAALHSQWTPEWVTRYREGGTKVLITYHDTGVPNSQQCLDLYAVADAFVVHEPCADLPHAHYWRQGVPDLPPDLVPWTPSGRPWVGSVGFPFPWKHFDLLCEASNHAGWGTLLIAPGATEAQITAWQALNPDRVAVYATFQPREVVVRLLHACDATAFLYHTHNTGTSGAIRQGIAARKPVIASRFPFGRQFRDLQEDDLGRRVITWIEPTLDTVVQALSRVTLAPYDPGVQWLAERDSWAGVGRRYAALYRELVGR